MRIVLSALLALVIGLYAAPALAVSGHPVIGMPATGAAAVTIPGVPAVMTLGYHWSQPPAWITFSA